jgi:hypothetical protein
MLRNSKISIVAAALLVPAAFAGSALAAEDAEKSADQSSAGATEATEASANEASANEAAAEQETFWNPRKKPPARMAVAVNPIGLIFGMFLGEFDYGLNDRLSLDINADYWSLGVSYFDTTAWGVGIGAQYFPAEVAASGPLYQGFYVYPSLQFASVSVKEKIFGTSTSYISVAPQAVAGWQWDWRPFTVRFGAGAAYYIGSVDGGFRSDLHGLRFVLDGTLGLTFGG